MWHGSESSLTHSVKERLDKAHAISQAMGMPRWSVMQPAAPSHGYLPPKKRAALEGTQSQSSTAREVVTVLELWAQLQRAGLPPTVLAFSHVVSAYSVARCDRMSLDLYRDLSARYNLKPHMFAYELVLQSALRLGNVTEIADIMDRAESNGYMVSKQELEAVYLAYHRAGAADRAHAILGRLQKLKAKMSNHVHFSMLEAAVNAKDLAQVSTLLQQIFFEVKPSDLWQYGPLLEKIIWTSTQRCNAECANVVMTCLESHEQCSVGLEAFNQSLSLAVSCCHGELAERALAVMGRMRLPISQKHLEHRLMAHAGSYDLPAVAQALQDIARMGFALSDHARETVVTAIVYVWRSKAETRDGLINLNHLLELEGPPPTELVNCIITAYSRHGFYTQAMQLFETAPFQYGCNYDANTYAAMMELCTHPRRVRLSECLDLANEMTSLKIKLTSRCFSALTLTLLRARRVPMALEMIQRAVRQGAPVSAYTYSSVVRLLARRTDFGAAEDLLANMAEAGLTPEPALLEYVKRMRTSDGFDYHDPRHVPSHVAGPVGDMEEEDRDGVDEDSAANVDSLPAEVGVDGPSEPVLSPLLTQGPGSGVPIPPPSRRPASPSS